MVPGLGRGASFWTLFSLPQCPGKMLFLWKCLETLLGILDQTVIVFSELRLVPRQISESDFYLPYTRPANIWMRFLRPSRRPLWGRAGA